MDNCLMWRNIDTAVFLGTGKTKHMVILINSTANCTEGVVTVCQNIRYRKTLQSGSTCSLDNSYKSNIMGCQFIKFNLKLVHITGSIMGF